MGPRARSSSPARALAVLGVVGFASVVACGLSVTATGGPDSADASGPSSNSTTLDAAALDGGEQQADCDAGSMCSGSCSDPKTDPQNCGGCGNVCPSGQSCNDGSCDVLCINDKQKCGSACVDLQTDPRNCGMCTKQCVGSDVCSKGNCQANCDPSLAPCAGAAGQPGYCADLTSDPDNCTMCGQKCGATEICTSIGCTSLCAPGVTVADIYGSKTAPNMVGCVGTKNWKDRALLCAPGMKPCTPEQWVSRHGTAAPRYNYWTDADLNWSGSDKSCAAVERGGFSCDTFGGFGRPGSTGNPMRVCAVYQDGVGNHCTWTGCGLNNQTNQYFGGCQNNTTAGTLCCTSP